MDDKLDASSPVTGDNDGLGNGDIIPPEEVNKQEQQENIDKYGDPGRKPWGGAIPPDRNNGGEMLDDGYPKDLEIPIRYIKGMEGDEEEARRRWITTLEWREEFKVDSMMDEPQPNFDVIKKYYPHFMYNISKEGCCMYYEVPGKINLKELRQNGVDVPMLIRHYAMITEFLWWKIDPSDEGKLLTVLDLTGVKISQFVGEVREFMEKAAKLISAHYPERSYKILIINAPWWISAVWAVMSPLMHANTRAKVHMSGKKNINELAKYVDLDMIPAIVGGNSQVPVYESEEEIVLKNHIDAVLKKHNVEMNPDMAI
eukprot:409405_1